MTSGRPHREEVWTHLAFAVPALALRDNWLWLGLQGSQEWGVPSSVPACSEVPCAPLGLGLLLPGASCQVRCPRPPLAADPCALDSEWCLLITVNRCSGLGLAWGLSSVPGRHRESAGGVVQAGEQAPPGRRVS